MTATGDEYVSLSQLKEYMDNKLYPVNSLFFCTDDTNPASIVGGYGSASKRGFCTPLLLVRLERSRFPQMAGLLTRLRGRRLELRCGSESHRRSIDRGDVRYGSYRKRGCHSQSAQDVGRQPHECGGGLVRCLFWRLGTVQRH